MKIEVLGAGCAKCKRLEKNVKKAVEKAGIDAEVVKVEDINRIAESGIMLTPALIIDGEVKASGRVLSVDEIIEKLK